MPPHLPWSTIEGPETLQLLKERVSGKASVMRGLEPGDSLQALQFWPYFKRKQYFKKTLEALHILWKWHVQEQSKNRNSTRSSTCHRRQRLHKANWAIFQLLSVSITFKANLKWIQNFKMARAYVKSWRSFYLHLASAGCVTPHQWGHSPASPTPPAGGGLWTPAIGI